ncbi:uncharacterized protein MELLADRAFT_107829 [Melampsora larici-populina 98AG31]|uniref:Uncharacterized protein n=1 Tax=Melampsora larici-populina (strain 98AG31 / pathotype 3-4-7) TaxID=747676 RepID=F4RR27_MELLP|nr:uncharacterized protein MELLADRAFT_107829 [Melampsora larici-populina 98AG31]EGG05138.1 hypothetical protein MELLADRAFT_107829 [Melampsora larici-populina 98AG31]
MTVQELVINIGDEDDLETPDSVRKPYRSGGLLTLEDFRTATGADCFAALMRGGGAGGGLVDDEACGVGVTSGTDIGDFGDTTEGGVGGFGETVTCGGVLGEGVITRGGV